MQLSLACETVEWVRGTVFLQEKISYMFAHLEKSALIFGACTRIDPINQGTGLAYGFTPNFYLQGTYVTTVTASDGDTMLNAPVEYFIDAGSLKVLTLNKRVIFYLFS